MDTQQIMGFVSTRICWIWFDEINTRI